MKAIIFDLDGVLLDNIGSITRSITKISKALGKEVPSKREITKALGNTFEEASKILWPDLEIESVKAFSRILKDKSSTTTSIKGASNILRRIRTSGYKIAIVTNKERTVAYRHLRKAKLKTSLFDVIICQDDTEKNKPDPEPIIEACRRLGVSPRETIYIGDTLVDYFAAKEARTEFIGVLSGGLDSKSCKEIGVTKVLDSIRDLPEFLGLYQ